MAIARSQFITATGTSVSSVSAVFSSAVSSGNSVVVVVGNFTNANASGPLSTVADTRNTGAGYVRRIFSTMSNASDTSAHLYIYDKLNLSSGAGASTYRVEADIGGVVNAGVTFCAIEYSGGPFTVGSSASANGTSSSPAGGALTASSSPALFVSGAIYNSAGTLFASTATGGGANYVTTADPSNANQVLNVIDAVSPSSLTENIGHSLTTSTRWLAGSMVYMGAGAGGGATAVINPWVMPLLGLQ